MKTTKAVFGIIGISLALAAQAQSQSFLTDGLVAYYPLDGNADDASGNGNNGTAVGGVSYVYGLLGLVADFDGNAQCISLPNFISIYQDLSVTFYVKTSASDPNLFPYSTCLVSRDIAGAAYDWNICLGQGRKIQFHTGNPDPLTDTSIPVSVLVTPNDILSNEWVHVACVADSANQLKTTFLNGQAAASTSWSPHPFANNYVPIFLGACASASLAAQTCFAGEMADVRIYNRALSSNEVAELYAIGPTLPSCAPSAATAIASVADGLVVSVTVSDSGCGYTNTPTVRFIGGGGSGAEGAALMTNGLVVGVIITNPGSGYINPPAVVIAQPFIPQPTMSIVSVPVIAGSTAQIMQLGFGNLSPYDNYQLQFTPLAGGTWTNIDLPFLPTSNLSTQEVVVSGNAGFFRVQYAP